MRPNDHDNLNEYLDGDNNDEADLTLSQYPQEEVVRHLIVAGILQQLSHDTEHTIHQQIQKGMVAINHVVHQESQHRQRRTRRIGNLVAAAAITVTALLFLWQPVNRQPVIEQMQAYLRANQDRQYRMLPETGDSALNFIEAETSLSVRGKDKFLMSFSGNVLGNQFVVQQGFDGKDYWVLLPAIRFSTPVLISSKSLASCWGADNAGVALLGRGIDRLEIGAHIFGLLHDLQESYEVNIPVTESKTFTLRNGQLAVVAERHAQTNPDYPKTIEFLFDPARGTVEEIVAEYFELPTQLTRMHPYRKIRYQLRGEFPQDDSIYQHQGHHDGSRKILRLD